MQEYSEAGVQVANGHDADDIPAAEPSRIYHDRSDIPPPPAVAGPARKRERWVKLPTTADFGYQNWFIYMWTNFPSDYLQRFDDLQVDEKREILNKIFRQHSEWRDFEKNLYPQPGDPDADTDFWALIPQEIYNQLITLMSVEQRQLSFLVQEKRPTSRRS